MVSVTLRSNIDVNKDTPLSPVLITGASSGFGETCARKFAAEWHRLIFAARRT
jgi:NADP-dependent 3-hydroxy acid dehydrogenase YdfG